MSIYFNLPEKQKNMKNTKLILLLTILLLPGMAVSVNADNENIQKNKDETRQSYVALPLGFVFIPFDDDLNTMLESAGFGGFDDYMITYDAKLLGGSEKKKGGLFLSHGVTESNKDNKRAGLSLIHFGLIAERTHVATKRFELSTDLKLGYGMMNLVLIHDRPDNFENLISDTHIPSTVLKNSFYSIQPSVNIRFNFSKYLGIGVSAGYMFAHNMSNKNNWTIDDYIGIYDKGPLHRFGAPSFSAELVLRMPDRK